MHFHGYLWVGEKAEFDKESRRRLPVEPWPGADPDTSAQRAALHRTLTEEFLRSPLPPIEVALWLLKPAHLVAGSWDGAESAAAWLGARLEEYAPRREPLLDGRTAHLRGLVGRLTGTLLRGGDVSLGYYLGPPAFLSLAVVACSPNRAAPGLPCPERADGRAPLRSRGPDSGSAPAPASAPPSGASPAPGPYPAS
ncbi:hypothetical protein [Streptomyces sp. WAC 00631]|uniref:hypothetical protein n=1 Tax=Streptomyces sp. WAC 00631 TaxID=2203201 RepID=UPI00225E0EED|nr:hypothetical protein [Streptomyces sp. WAC 00631]